MKLLLISFACEPNRGSEPGVGWNWAIHLSNYVQVTVITRTNNKSSIEKELKNKSINNISFIYFDIPFVSKIKKKIPFGVQLYFLLWEFLVVKKIKTSDPAIIQRMTFVTTVSLLRLYKLNVPYIMSFCGGGELTPISIYNKYSLKFKAKEILRKFYNSAYTYNTITKKVFDNSKLVLSVTNDTKDFIERMGYVKKNEVIPAIGLDSYFDDNSTKVKKNSIIYAGSLIYLKNINIIVRAFEYIRKLPIKLDIYGKGDEEEKLKKLVVERSLESKIFFYRSIPQIELHSKMHSYDLAIHASSHDSGSLFLLEAISLGIPVLFLNTGGPKEIFSEIKNYPLKVDPDLSYEEIIKDFANRIEWFYTNFEVFIKNFQIYRKTIIEKYKWDNKAKKMLKLYEQILNEDSSNT